MVHPVGVVDESVQFQPPVLTNEHETHPQATGAIAPSKLAAWLKVHL